MDTPTPGAVPPADDMQSAAPVDPMAAPAAAPVDDAVPAAPPATDVAAPAPAPAPAAAMTPAAPVVDEPVMPAAPTVGGMAEEDGPESVEEAPAVGQASDGSTPPPAAPIQ